MIRVNAKPAFGTKKSELDVAKGWKKILFVAKGFSCYRAVRNINPKGVIILC